MRIFLNTGRSVIGRYSLGVEAVGDFGMGLMIPSHHEVGTCPESQTSQIILNRSLER